MPAIETQSGNPANGRGRRDPTTAAEQNDQIVLCLRSYVGNEKDHRFECGPGFTHSLIVDGTARGSLTGDVDYRQLSKKYSTSSLFRKVYPRIEILDAYNGLIPIQVRNLTVTLSNRERLETDIHIYAKSRVNDSNAVEKLVQLFNSNEVQKTNRCGGDEYWKYITAPGVRSILEPHLRLMFRESFARVDDPLSFLNVLQSDIMGDARSDGLLATYGFSVPFAEVSFDESMADYTRRAILEARSNANVCNENLRITHEGNMLKLTFAKEEYDFLNGGS